MCDYSNEDMEQREEDTEESVESPSPTTVPPERMTATTAAAGPSQILSGLRRRSRLVRSETSMIGEIRRDGGEGGEGDMPSEKESAEDALTASAVVLAESPSLAGRDYLRISVMATSLSDTARYETRVEACMEEETTMGSTSSSTSHRARQTPLAMCHSMLTWDRSWDTALLEYVNSQGFNNHHNSLCSPPMSFSLPRRFMTYGALDLLATTTPSQPVCLLDIHNRALLLNAFNKNLEELLPILNLTNSDPASLGALVRRNNSYIFLHIKQPMLDKTISASTVTSGMGLPAHILLDNFKALASRERGETDPSQSCSCFIQAYKQLVNKDASIYKYMFSTDRVFQINFEGESGIDAGGVFREGMTRIVEDLFSEHLSLLCLCPNAQHQVYMNMDKYVPNPSQSGPMAMSMFEFVGKLMGLSLRAKLALPFEFPSLLWRQVVGETVSIVDLMAVDALTSRLLEAMRYCERDGVDSQESFSAKYGDKLRFVCAGSDGVERELCRNGRDKRVTFSNRLEYCDAMLTVRLGEGQNQISAIARGLAAVVPMRLLQLFSWQQLEVLVAGDPTVDIELWKSKTEAVGVSAKTLALFWKVMSSLTPKEQAGFVRFAWGRSRLPPAKEFTTKMKLTPAGREKLPVAHTCFFSVELPLYTTEEEMRHGLMTAIHYGASGVLLG